MRTLVHLSDLHFGRIDPAVIEPLIERIAGIRPDLVVVSGDLTQRARTAQFTQARAFLDRLPSPQIVVPGNHDVPMYAVISRFLQPSARYQRYITGDLEPFFADEEIAVVGINTARSLTIKGGRINAGQMERVCARFAPLGPAVTRIIVTHHPFDLPASHGEKDLVGRARHAMKAFADCRADLFLSGHLHVSHSGSTAARYRISGHSALVVQAGTATSSRARGESNSFNVVRIDRPRIDVERLDWRPAERKFDVSFNERFQFLAGEWSLLEGSK